MMDGSTSPTPGPAVSDEAGAALQQYLTLLLSANEHLNLTAIRDRPGMRRRHIDESLALVRLLEDEGLLPAGARVIDVGSGAGLPGIPLAAVRPDVSVTLLEATGKKVAFLTDAIAALHLHHVNAIHARAEEAAHDPALRGGFNVAIARAVAALPTLVELALPFVREGGYLAAVKGSKAREEIEHAVGAIRACGGRLAATRPLAAADEGLAVVLVEKTGATPVRLPRRPGMPAKRPLH